MATRTRAGNKKESGFYKILSGEVDMIEEEYQSNKISLTSKGVYEVERLIEKRNIKVRMSWEALHWHTMTIIAANMIVIHSLAFCRV